MATIENATGYTLKRIGIVRSNLKPWDDYHTGLGRGPYAWLKIDSPFADGLDSITPGVEVMIMARLHVARRDFLSAAPGNPEKAHDVPLSSGNPKVSGEPIFRDWNSRLILSSKSSTKCTLVCAGGRAD